jgi:hypothetical protein
MRHENEPHLGHTGKHWIVCKISSLTQNVMGSPNMKYFYDIVIRLEIRYINVANS